MFLWHTPIIFWSTSLLSVLKICFWLILQFLCPSLGISYFSGDPWFFFVKTGIRNQYLGAMWAHSYWGVFASRSLQQTDFENINYLYIYTCTCSYTCTHTQFKHCKFAPTSPIPIRFPSVFSYHSLTHACFFYSKNPRMEPFSILLVMSLTLHYVTLCKCNIGVTTCNTTYLHEHLKSRQSRRAHDRWGTTRKAGGNQQRISKNSREKWALSWREYSAPSSLNHFTRFLKAFKGFSCIFRLCEAPAVFILMFPSNICPGILSFMLLQL